MIKNPPSSAEGAALELEHDAHWAKYTCVLISGYIEQSVKEIFLEHVADKSSGRVKNYVKSTWPNAKNMNSAALVEIVNNLEPAWAEELGKWIDEKERKKEINEIIKWRNNIAHGKESATTNVTLNSVKEKFRVASELIDYIESLVLDK